MATQGGRCTLTCHPKTLGELERAMYGTRDAPMIWQDHLRKTLLDRISRSLYPGVFQSDAQTEDGHAMIKSETFHSFPNLSQRALVCSRCETHVLQALVTGNCAHTQCVDIATTVDKCAPTSRLTCTCRQRQEGKWQVDCEAAVGSCR